MKFLKNHPFAVEAHFERSLVLTFAVPQAQLRPLVPDCLELDIFQEKWAFVAVALVQTTGLRPKGFPKFLGNDFFLVGYRIFVRHTNKAGKRLRGLYILQSETDRHQMVWLGNVFTHYNYRYIDIKQTKDGPVETIRSERAGLRVVLEHTHQPVPLPVGSPFGDWAEARRYAGPLPHTFTYDHDAGTVLTVEGVRENWTPAPVKVTTHEVGFLDQKPFEGAILANAFEIRDIPYYWKKGKTEPWP